MSPKSKANKPVSEIIVNKKRWVLTNYPTQALAQDAEMSLDEYTKNFCSVQQTLTGQR